MHLGSRKKNDPTRLTDETNLRIKLHRFRGPRKGPWILLDILCRIEPEVFVPLCIVILSGIISNGLTPVFWMECHGILRGDSIDWDPPIDLATWSRIPRIPVRVP